MFFILHVSRNHTWLWGKTFVIFSHKTICKWQICWDPSSRSTVIPTLFPSLCLDLHLVHSSLLPGCSGMWQACFCRQRDYKEWNKGWAAGDEPVCSTQPMPAREVGWRAENPQLTKPHSLRHSAGPNSMVMYHVDAPSEETAWSCEWRLQIKPEQRKY